LDDVKENMPPATAATDTHAESGRISTVYRDLRDLIVHGRLPPGARIAEGSLADWLGVSRTPVREALQRLRQERLLVEIGGGARVRARLAVAPLRRPQMEELYSLAGALESFAARALAAWPEQDRARLARKLEKIERGFSALARKNPIDFDALFEAHDAFHRQLIHDVVGAETAALLQTIRPQLDRYEWFYAPLIGPDFTATYAEHGAIIKALTAGNSRQLERAVRANWHNSAARLGPVIEEYGSWLKFPTLSPTSLLDWRSDPLNAARERSGSSRSEAWGARSTQRRRSPPTRRR
jgi:DNA-binding GntR family transcriptional regulator